MALSAAPPAADAVRLLAGASPVPAAHPAPDSARPKLVLPSPAGTQTPGSPTAATTVVATTVTAVAPAGEVGVVEGQRTVLGFEAGGGGQRTAEGGGREEG